MLYFNSRTVRPAYKDKQNWACQSLRACSSLDVFVSRRVRTLDGSYSGPLICMASMI